MSTFSEIPTLHYIKENNSLIIHGNITNNDNPPPKRNGQPNDPDPISRLCHKAKEHLIKTNGACVCYYITRTTNFNGFHEITINFMFSNTGKQEMKYNHPKFHEISSNWEKTMALYCQALIEEYIDDNFIPDHAS